MVDILNAVLADGLPAVEIACAEAVGHGVHSSDVVLSILAGQREPGEKRCAMLCRASSSRPRLTVLQARSYKK